MKLANMLKQSKYENARQYLLDNDYLMRNWELGQKVLTRIFKISAVQANRAKREVMDWLQSELSDIPPC